jgi:DNA polymerase III subunit gamma/tau
MGYLAIARKWRPSRFDDLVGQGHVVQTLKNAILFNRVSHAYLFSGARGIGKTSVARIFAKTLRCPKVKDAIPCNECPECVAISESRSVDVVEIDGASNNGVEAVRGIRENVAYGASSGQYKIYIIDEVHMLSISAFNALLKTLEEPPAHVLFILATTEVQKIPMTIVSRCQRFEFRRLTNQQMVIRLQQILAEERLKIAEEGLRTIASHSDGSLRDALSLLDQVLSYYGQTASADAELNEKQVVESLGVSESNSVRQFFSFLFAQDLKSLMELISDTYFSGVDLKHFAERCLEELRLCYLVVVGRTTKQTVTPEALDISATHFAELNEKTRSVSLLQVERMSQILSKTIHQLSWSSLPRFVMEMAAVRMSHLKQLEQVEAAILNPPPVTAATAPVPSARVAPLDPTPPSLEAPPPPSSLETPPASLEGPPPSPPPTPQTRVDSVTLTWKGFVEALMKKRPLLGALVSHAHFKVESGERGKLIHLAFPTGSFYERQANEAKTRLEIDALAKAFFGPETQLNLASELSDATRSLEESKRVEEAGLKKEALEHPMVLKMKEMLGAEIVDVNVEGS